MKLLCDILLLICFVPGTVLPSFLTEQLIAPVRFQATAESAKVSQDQTPADDKSSPEHDEVFAAPSVFSATRPATFPFSRGDLRSKRSECTIFSVSQLSFSDAGLNKLSSPSSAAHEVILTLLPAEHRPAIRPHAPPF